MRPFRFGFQATAGGAAGIEGWARAAEVAGFDVFHVGDHVGSPGPLSSLAVAASSTDRIRLCPLVLNNDLRHPGVVAGELAVLDHLSHGRLEIGIGAGHDPPRVPGRRDAVRPRS